MRGLLTDTSIKTANRQRRDAPGAAVREIFAGSSLEEDVRKVFLDHYFDTPHARGSVPQFGFVAV